MSKSINYYRRRITRFLTGSLIKTKNKIPTDLPENFEFKTILISRPNHRLGNLLLITPILIEIENKKQILIKMADDYNTLSTMIKFSRLDMDPSIHDLFVKKYLTRLTFWHICRAVKY